MSSRRPVRGYRRPGLGEVRQQDPPGHPVDRPGGGRGAAAARRVRARRRTRPRGPSSPARGASSAGLGEVRGRAAGQARSPRPRLGDVDPADAVRDGHRPGRGTLSRQPPSRRPSRRSAGPAARRAGRSSPAARRSASAGPGRRGPDSMGWLKESTAPPRSRSQCMIGVGGELADGDVGFPAAARRAPPRPPASPATVLCSNMSLTAKTNPPRGHGRPAGSRRSVAAQLEEAVVDPDRGQPQHLGEDRAQRLLDGVAPGPPNRPRAEARARAAPCGPACRSG